MKNLFYKIVKFWRHINIMRNTAIHVADCYESYMRRGTWRIRFAEKPMLLHITEASLSFFRENKRKAYNYMGNMYRIIIIVRDLILRISWRYQVNVVPKETFQTDCIMLNSNGGVYLYDFTAGIVEKRYKQSYFNEGYMQLKQAGYWNVFSSPVLWLNGYEAREKIIKPVNERITNRERYLCLLKAYQVYFKIAVPVSSKPLGSVKVPYKEIVPYCNDFLHNDILSIPINWYVLHGDAFKGNVLYTGEEKLTVIDYAKVGENVFFYDLLFWPCADIWLESDWGLWMELQDEKTEAGKIFNEILLAQGITPTLDIKQAMLVLVPGIWGALTEHEKAMCEEYRGITAHAIERAEIIVNGLLKMNR